MNHGISILHGPHHVAQKFSRTTLPLESESLTEAPLASVRVKSGAALRLISDDDAARTGDDGAQPVSSAHAKAIRASTVSEAGGVMAESSLHLSFRWSEPRSHARA